MPANQKKARTPKKRAIQTVRKRQSRGRIYLFGALILIVVVGVGLYVYASSQSTPDVVYAKLVTPQGVIEIELYQKATPKTVTNFVNLAKSGFYNNLVWHRIVKEFVIQTGDPNSRNAGGDNNTWGQGGSSQTVPLESVPSLHNYAGYVAMAHLPNDVNSGTSQFYINLNDTNASSLDGSYTVFGRVISGMNVALAIANVSVYSGSNQPITPVFLTSVAISNSP
jgi:cyclophilin family peptidyl-prolyl cis-trans isomerase